MPIIIQALARDRDHSISLLARLAQVDAHISRVHLHPAGIHRLLRRRAEDRGSPAIRTSTWIALITAVIGAGTGTVLALAFLTGSARSGLLQDGLIVLGTLVAGGMAGLAVGMLLGGLVGMFLPPAETGAVPGEADEPVLMDLSADTIATAMAVETMLTESGAREVHIAKITAA